jgi:hypothetical protein
MKSNYLLIAAIAVCAGAIDAPARAAEWITAPSYYTHDSTTAERVNQYSQIGPFYYHQRGDFMQSGYRHNRSTFQFGGSADNLHIVEEWGNPIQPYEQWRFPYRPFGSPYQAWGPPYGGLGGGGGGYGGWGGGGFGGFNGGGSGTNYPGFSSGPYNTAQPWTDGYYPRYDLHQRSDYYRPYRAEPGF